MDGYTQELSDLVRKVIRNVADFPKPGIQFKDISPLLRDVDLMGEVVGWLGEGSDGAFRQWPSTGADIIVGLDARGFLFGVPMAFDHNLPFVMCRKAGKLPGETVSHSYALEYGEATVELQADAIPEGSSVVIVDDLLATGGTAAAAVHLVRELGGEVLECVFVVELEALGGRACLEALGVTVRSLVTY